MYKIFSFFSFYLTNIKFNFNKIQKIQQIFKHPDESLTFKAETLNELLLITQTINRIIL